MPRRIVAFVRDGIGEFHQVDITDAVLGMAPGAALRDGSLSGDGMEGSVAVLAASGYAGDGSVSLSRQVADFLSAPVPSSAAA